MNIKILKTQKGFTLVELLAAISLIAIVIALSSTLIIQLVSSNAKTSDQISLGQDTNVLISELKHQYYEESKKVEDGKTFDLCYNSQISEIQFNINNDDQALKIENNCIKDVIKKDNLPVELTTVGNTGQTFTLKTTWTNKVDYVLSIKDEDEVGKIACTYIDNTEFSNYIRIGNGTDNNDKLPCYTFEKSATFNNGLYLHNKGNVIVHHILRVKKGLKLHNHSYVTVKNDLHIDDGLSLHNQAHIKVEGDLYVKGDITISNQASLTVTKNLYLMGNMNIDQHGTITYNDIIYVDEDN